MSKVYLQQADTPDKQLGRVNNNIRIYRRDPGSDDRIGKVDLDCFCCDSTLVPRWCIEVSG